MSARNITKEELINELQELQIKYDTLKASYSESITELKNTEEALQKSESNISNLVGKMPDGVYKTTHEGKVVELNPAMLKILGYSKEELMGINIGKELYFDTADREQMTLHGMSNELISYRLRKKDGSEVWVEDNGWYTYNDSGEIIFHEGVIRDITERRQAEEALRRNEEMMVSSQSVAHICSYSTNLNENELEESVWVCSPEFYKIFGIDKTYPHTIEGWAGFIHPDHREELVAYHEYVVKNRIPFSHEYKIIRINDGVERWVQGTGELVYDENGKPVRMYGAIQDITERKLAEEKYMESQRKLATLMGNLPGIAFRCMNDQDWTMIFMSEGCFELTGFNPQELEGNKSYSYANLIHEDDADIVWREIQDAINNKTSWQIEYRIHTKNEIEKWVWEQGCGIYNNEGNIEVLEGFVTDITERKQYELLIRKKSEEIEFNNLRLESLLKISQYQTGSLQELLDFALNEAIILTNSKIGYIYFYNETNKQFILNTWSKDVMKECTVMNPQTIYDLDKTGWWGEAVRQRKPIVLNDYQAENTHKRGTPVGHVQLSKFLTIPVIFDDKIVAVAGVANKENDYDNSDIRQLSLLMDSVWKISERILLIKDLTIAKEKAEESDRLKSAFLANMSHEIRTPMNGILGFAELLKEPDLSGAEQQEYIKIIEKSGTRMLNIINDIVDISKIEAGLMTVNIKETDINEKIEFIYTFFKPQVEEKGMQFLLKNTLPAKEAIIKTDSEKVYSILTNLVKNAIKYSTEGIIEFGVSTSSTTGSGNEPVKLLQFYVKDTGIGIPKNKQSDIFERFIQVDTDDKMARQGAGLGLSISKAYMEMLGGKIWVESEEGIGSTFYFTLPYNTETEVKKVIGKVGQTQDGENQIIPEVSRLKILIAEDDETSKMLIAINVDKFGKEILKARNGYEAVEVCRNNPDTDLILMDIQMPLMNGYEATRLIREFNKDVVIIAQTAYGLSGDSVNAIESGCNDYIAKPINKAELHSLIQKHFRK